MLNPSAAFLLRTSSLALALTAGLVAFGGQAHAQSRGPYVDAGTYLIDDDTQYETWIHLRRQLARNFDYICGDTFCEGDYTNIQSLRYTCSVQRSSGRIGSCGWAFAGSNETVVAMTGRIESQPAAWLCTSPIVRGTTIEAFLDALQGDEPLYATLPMSERTLYDGLIDCL
jgi:hypothetical protein